MADNPLGILQKLPTINAMGSTDALTGVDGTGNNAADLTTTEQRLDDVEAKIDEIIATMKSGGLMIV